MLSLTIGLLVVSFFLPCVEPGGGSDGIGGSEKPARSGIPDLRFSLRDAIRAAIDNNVNVRLPKERVAAPHGQVNSSLGPL